MYYKFEMPFFSFEFSLDLGKKDKSDAQDVVEEECDEEEDDM